MVPELAELDSELDSGLILAQMSLVEEGSQTEIQF
jgi:hypothetical protein